MSEKRPSGVPYTSDNADEQRLWDELAELPQPAPSSQLRRRFHDQLDAASRPTLLKRWLAALGLRDLPGMVTAMSCLVVGLIAGAWWNAAPSANRGEFAQLQQQVATLNRNLILDRLASDSASKRLLGVMDAVDVAASDSEIARALLARAVDDRVYSVRSAAIDAIGPQLNTPAVGDELMASLERAESPLVQLALVDLVLRHGNAQQLERLLRLSEQGKLDADVVKHIQTSVWRDRA